MGPVNNLASLGTGYIHLLYYYRESTYQPIDGEKKRTEIRVVVDGYDEQKRVRP